MPISDQINKSSWNKGMKMSPEYCAKLSAIRKVMGMTPEHNAKMQAARKPYHHSAESKEKLRQARLGTHASEETKRKLSEMRKGRAAPNKGIKLPKEWRDNIAKGLRGRKWTDSQRERMKFILKGDKCYNWKGGVTALGVKIKNLFEYRQWRSEVFHRDNFACQMCEVRGGKIQAHHIKAFAKIIEENNIKTTDEALVCAELWDINNGQTLCVECHKLTDNYKNKKPLCQ